MRRGKKQTSTSRNTEEPETLAVITLEYLLDHKKVRTDIKRNDKHRDIDGYLELLDEFRNTQGKLEVQVKKLPNGKRKIQCPLKLFSYSERMLYPVLLIGVDIEQKKAYWVHVGEDLIASSTIRSGQKTKVVNFPIENVIDGKNTKYVSEWQTIAESYKARIRDYSDLTGRLLKSLKRSNLALGRRKKYFRNIHLFLDELNTLLDGKFSVVKRILYPNAWKVGLAYSTYEDNTVSYSLYPIRFETNDVQIKEFDSALRKKLWEEGIGIRGHNFENPIKVRPRKYAIEIVESETLRLLKNRLLSHAGNGFLAREFIFASLDRYFQQLGLEKKDEYSLGEIEKAFDQLLPARIDPHTRATAIISMGHYRFCFSVFQEFLSSLKSDAFDKIRRVYVQKDFSRLRKGGLVYNLFSPHAVETNLRIFFDNLPEVYTKIISRNFPKIAKELPLFGEISRVIVLFNVKEEYKTFQDAPIIEFFYLKPENQENLEIEIHRRGEVEKLDKLSFKSVGKYTEIDGKKYRIVSGSKGVLDFIYDDLPMFNYVYTILEDNLKGYFTNLRI